MLRPKIDDRRPGIRTGLDRTVSGRTRPYPGHAGPGLKHFLIIPARKAREISAQGACAGLHLRCKPSPGRRRHRQPPPARRRRPEATPSAKRSSAAHRRSGTARPGAETAARAHARPTPYQHERSRLSCPSAGGRATATHPGKNAGERRRTPRAFSRSGCPVPPPLRAAPVPARSARLRRRRETPRWPWGG